MSGKTVLLLGSFAPSLVHFRGALIAAIVERGHRVVAAAPAIAPEVAAKLLGLGAEPRELRLVNASLNPLGMMQSLREVRALIRNVRPDVLIGYTIRRAEDWQRALVQHATDPRLPSAETSVPRPRRRAP